MRTLVTFVAACLLMTVGSMDANAQRKKKSPGTGPESRTYAISGTYTRLDVKSAFDVVVSDTVKAALVTLPAHLHDKVVVEVEHDELTIRLKGQHRLKERPRVILPHNPRLTKVELSAASTFTTPLGLSGDALKLDIGGASRFEGNLTGKKVDIELSGASWFHGHVEAGMVEYDSKGASSALMTGSVFMTLDLDMSGASGLDAKNFTAKKVRGEMSGASNVVVQCTESLRVNLTGVSSLTYIGIPREVNCQTDALSKVIKK